MKLTTEHPQSSYGVPVFVDAKNNPVDYVDGINWIKEKYKLTTKQLADRIGISDRTVDDWLAGQMPSKSNLLLLRNIFGL